MKKLTIFLLLTITLLNFAEAGNSVIYAKDGIVFSSQVTKVNTVYNPVLKRNIVVWKVVAELKNTSEDAVQLKRPTILKYNRNFVTNAELDAIRNQGVGYMIFSNVNLNVLPSTELEPNTSNSKETYVVTFDDTDLLKEQYSWDLQYSK